MKVIAVSSDGRERAQAMADRLDAPNLLPALDFALTKNYPARGEFTGAV